MEYDLRLLKCIFINNNLLQQTISNVIMFIPIGFISAKLSYSPIIIGTVLSIIIETMQLVYRKGVFEFDDIIANTLGTIVGQLLYVSIKYLMDKMKKNY